MSSDLSSYAGADICAWLASLDPAQRKRESIALARYVNKRRQYQLQRQLQQEPTRTGRPPDFPRKRLIWFKACLIRRRQLVKSETSDVAAQIVGTHLRFDLAQPKVKARLERLAKGGESDIYQDARQLLDDLTVENSEKLSSELLALSRSDRRSGATESPRNGVSVPR